MSFRKIMIFLGQVFKSILEGKLLMRLGAEKLFPYFLGKCKRLKPFTDHYKIISADMSYKIV